MLELYKALADFQQEVPPIFKGTTGYGYKYADWSEILKVINPLLAKHSLGFSQPLDGTSVKTIIFHTKTGETIEGTVQIPQGVQLKGMNDFQVLGSAITYLRRYSLSSLLGLVTDEDADATGKQTNKTAVLSKDNPVTDEQRTMIGNLLKNFDINTKDDVTNYLYDNFGAVPTNEVEAKEVIDAINLLFSKRTN